MSKVLFVGLDVVHAERIAVTVAETAGEVRSLGVIPNRLESVRKLVRKLGPVQHLRACYEPRTRQIRDRPRSFRQAATGGSVYSRIAGIPTAAPSASDYLCGQADRGRRWNRPDQNRGGRPQGLIPSISEF